MTCKTIVKKRTDAPSVFVSDIVSIWPVIFHRSFF